MRTTVLMTLLVSLPLYAATRYVSLDGAHVWPFTDGWASAATNIQAAIDAATTNDVILVSNGVYRTGGRFYDGLTNRVLVPFRMILRSLSGASATVVEGATPFGSDAAIRCVYLGSGALLDGFTLSNGCTAGSGSEARVSGGGVYCADSSPMISNCVFTRCLASWGGAVYRGTVYNSVVTRCGVSGGTGGGVYSATLYNCLVTHNIASQGGGVFSCTLYNCTVASNSASYGGGVRDSTAYNSIVYHNVAGTGPNHYGFTSYYTCTTPGAYWSGAHNLTNDPAFIDPAGNYHLQTNSPCIDSGTNMAWMAAASDLDGHARIINGRVDIGCYEFIPEPAAGVLLVIMTAVGTWKLRKGTQEEQ